MSDMLDDSYQIRLLLSIWSSNLLEVKGRSADVDDSFDAFDSIRKLNLYIAFLIDFL
jgi:hypothetical protein